VPAVASILLAVERNEEALQAFNKACTLARQFGARIELFMCDAERGYALRHSWDQSGAALAATGLIEDAKAYLEALRRSVATPDLRITVDASCETPLYQGIVQKVLMSCPDLVVKAVGGGGGYGAAAGPGRPAPPSLNDWNLVRTCPVPLLLTRGGTWRPTPRIAASVDPSDAETPGFARQVVETAASFAAACHAELDLIFGQPDSSGTTPANGSLSALQALATEFRVPASQVYVLRGEPAQTLPAHAGHGRYDLVVLGALTHARGPADLVGALTDRLLQSLDCDFLLLKPGTYSCPIRPESRQPAAAG
jgi:universal stress protein E